MGRAHDPGRSGRSDDDLGGRGQGKTVGAGARLLLALLQVFVERGRFDAGFLPLPGGTAACENRGADERSQSTSVSMGSSHGRFGVG